VRYLRLLRMQRVRHALRNGATTVTQVVQRHGFGEVGRFAAEYRVFYGELPSTTLNRSLGRLASKAGT
jgi:AraC-like DNA-binding protein